MRNKEERDMGAEIIQRENDIQRQWEDSKIVEARYNKRYNVIGKNVGGPRYLRVGNMDNRKNGEGIRALIKYGTETWRKKTSIGWRSR